MRKQMKTIALILAVIMVFAAAGLTVNATIGKASGEENAVVISMANDNSTGGNSTGNSTEPEDYTWTTLFGNFTMSGSGSTPQETSIDLTDPTKPAKIYFELAAQFSNGPIPTGTDTYKRKLNETELSATLDLDQDGTDDLKIMQDSSSGDYIVVKLSGAQKLKKSFTFTYPSPSQENVVIFNPVTVKVNTEDGSTTTTNTTTTNTTETNTTTTNTTTTNTTETNITETNTTETNTTEVAPPSGQQETEIVEKKNGRYEIRDGRAVLIGVTKKNIKSLTVLDTVTGKDGKKYPVTEIAAGACQNLKKLTKVTIGKNVTTIGAKAFFKCKKLGTLTVKAKKLKKVGAKAFGNTAPNPNIRCPKGKTKSYTKLFKKGGIKKAVWKE